MISGRCHTDPVTQKAKIPFGELMQASGFILGSGVHRGKSKVPGQSQLYPYHEFSRSSFYGSRYDAARLCYVFAASLWMKLRREIYAWRWSYSPRSMTTPSRCKENGRQLESMIFGEVWREELGARSASNEWSKTSTRSLTRPQGSCVFTGTYRNLGRFSNPASH
jgi:hypothetical protein